MHRALVEAARVPEFDRFQILTEHAPADIIYDPSYLDIKRIDDISPMPVSPEDWSFGNGKAQYVKTES